MATVTVTKKLTHRGTIVLANDIHVITLTGPDQETAGGPNDPPYAATGGGPVSGSVTWCRIQNPSNSDIRYSFGSSANPPPDPLADGSVDGSYRLPAGAIDSWPVHDADAVVKVTSGGTSVIYDVEAG